MNKKRILRITIALFMVISLSLTTSKTLAYWTQSVNSPTDSDAIALITTGEWQQVFPWDPNETYQVGDLVTNNGVTYEAKRDAPTREPGVDNGWNSDWNQL